jgi:hypothetical protein
MGETMRGSVEAKSGRRKHKALAADASAGWRPAAARAPRRVARAWGGGAGRLAAAPGAQICQCMGRLARPAGRRRTPGCAVDWCGGRKENPRRPGPRGIPPYGAGRRRAAWHVGMPGGRGGRQNHGASAARARARRRRRGSAPACRGAARPAASAGVGSGLPADSGGRRGAGLGVARAAASASRDRGLRLDAGVVLGVKRAGVCRGQAPGDSGEGERAAAKADGVYAGRDSQAQRQRARTRARADRRRGAQAQVTPAPPLPPARLARVLAPTRPAPPGPGAGGRRRRAALSRGASWAVRGGGGLGRGDDRGRQE